MVATYQVTARYITATVPTQFGPQVSSFSQHAILPDGVPDKQLEHLLSVGMIAPVTVGAPPVAEPEETPETPAAEPEPATAGSEGAPADDIPDADPEAEAKRAEARSKLPADGSKPDGRAGQPVWAEWLVTMGYDYAAVAKVEKKELVELANGLA